MPGAIGEDGNRLIGYSLVTTGYLTHNGTVNIDSGTLGPWDLSILPFRQLLI